MNQKSLILSLIQDDLIHNKLTLGLNALGMRTDDYTINLSETVFKLMQIENDEKGEWLFEEYLEIRERVSGIDVSELRELTEGLAEEIYVRLSDAKTLFRE